MCAKAGSCKWHLHGNLLKLSAGLFNMEVVVKWSRFSMRFAWTPDHDQVVDSFEQILIAKSWRKAKQSWNHFNEFYLTLLLLLITFKFMSLSVLSSPSLHILIIFCTLNNKLYMQRDTSFFLMNTSPSVFRLCYTNISVWHYLAFLAVFVTLKSGGCLFVGTRNAEWFHSLRSVIFAYWIV